MKPQKIIRILLITMFILLIPLFGMQINDNVNWDLTDFIVAGAMLIGAGLIYELIAHKTGQIAYKAAVGIALLTAFILIWMNLAVGIIGNENNPANMLYGAVLVVGGVGAIVARFQSRGMSRALLATAATQALVPIIAIVIWQPPINLGVLQVFILNTFFVVLFIGSALLFRRASNTK